eukprot:1393418-Amorphochlora_amoeboformis.AAC.1
MEIISNLGFRVESRRHGARHLGCGGSRKYRRSETIIGIESLKLSSKDLNIITHDVYRRIFRGEEV